MDAFVQLVSNVGFPIAACCFMFYQNAKLTAVITDLKVALESIRDDIAELKGGRSDEEH